jgi:hypothetical protein
MDRENSFFINSTTYTRIFSLIEAVSHLMLLSTMPAR